MYPVKIQMSLRTFGVETSFLMSTEDSMCCEVQLRLSVSSFRSEHKNKRKMVVKTYQVPNVVKLCFSRLYHFLYHFKFSSFRYRICFNAKMLLFQNFQVSKVKVKSLNQPYLFISGIYSHIYFLSKLVRTVNVQ